MIWILAYSMLFHTCTATSLVFNVKCYLYKKTLRVFTYIDYMITVYQTKMYTQCIIGYCWWWHFRVYFSTLYYYIFMLFLRHPCKQIVLSCFNNRPPQSFKVRGFYFTSWSVFQSVLNFARIIICIFIFQHVDCATRLIAAVFPTGPFFITRVI